MLSASATSLMKPFIYVKLVIIQDNTVCSCMLATELSFNKYVSGFWKTNRIITLGLFYFIGPPNSYTCTLPIATVVLKGLADSVLF